jgi:hypothetical protein
VQGKILIKFVAASQVLIERLLYPSLDLPTYAQTSWTWTEKLRKKERGSALQPPGPASELLQQLPVHHGQEGDLLNLVEMGRMVVSLRTNTC